MLGLGHTIVGITDFCVYPEAAVAGLPRVGGTKNPRLEDILALQPDLVVANREENTPEVVQALERGNVRVLLQFPKTVDDALESLYELAALFRAQNAMLAVESLARSVDYARAAGIRKKARYFCPIWFSKSDPGGEWWMTFNEETFPHDLLGLVGGENIFAGRQRRYPLEADLGREKPQDPEGRDTRYPRVTTKEVLEADPQIILLPSEPFAFDGDMKRVVEKILAGTTAVRAGNVHLVDGSLVTWHGVRMASALQELPKYFSGN